MSKKIELQKYVLNLCQVHSRWSRLHFFTFTDITFWFKYHYCSIKSDTYEWSSLPFRTVTYKFNYVTTSYYVFKIVSRALTYPNWARQWLGNYIERQPFDPPPISVEQARVTSSPSWLLIRAIVRGQSTCPVYTVSSYHDDFHRTGEYFTKN